MKTKYFFVLFVCFLPLILAGCGSTGGPGPRTWIDSPLTGSTLPLEPVIVRSHASSTSGTATVALFVNNTEIQLDNVTDPTSALVEISQVWEPIEPGDFAIQVISTDHDGNPGRSNFVYIHIGGTEEESPEAMTTSPPEVGDPTETSTPTLTPATEPQDSTVISDYLCRVGPGAPYEVVSTVKAGTVVEILGVGAQQGWIVISNPLYNAPCWIPADRVEIDPQIDLGSMQIFPIPVHLLPTDTSPAPSPPAAPTKLVANTTTCNASNYAVTVKWKDNANNETGYRVYRDGAAIATLGAGATSYVDHPSYSGPHTYKVEAFNGAGSAQSNSDQDDGCIF